MHAVAGSLVTMTVLLSGCGGSPPEAPPTNEASVAPQASATTEPTPEASTPVEISIEDAGARYLELVAPSNELAPAWNSAWEANDWQSLKAQAGPFAEALRTFADGLRAAEWPAEAQSTVDALVGELATEIVYFLQVAAAEGDDEIAAAVSQMPESTGAAQTLRIMLGLENAPIG